MVRLGDKGIIDLRIGDARVKRAYLGDVQVWPGYHRLKFWTEEHPIADMDSWMDGATASGLYCVSENVSDFWASLKDYPDMTSVYDATGDRSIPVIAVNGGADVSVLASKDGAVGTCYVNTDITSAQVVYEGEGSQRQAVGYAYIGAIVWSDDGTTRDVAWCWVVDTDVEIQDTATFTYGSETHTISRGGIYLPRATVGFSGSENELVTREYGVEEYTPTLMPTTLETYIAAGRLTAEIAYEQTIDGGTTIDWGDGTPSEVYAGTGYARHTYAASGTYTITIVPVAGNEVTFVASATSAHDEVVRASFGTGVTEIAYGAFSYSGKLVELQMREVHIIATGAFTSAPLESVTFWTGPITIGMVNMGVIGGAFQSCALESVQIPQAVTLLGADSFRWSSLRTAEVAAGTISYRAFGECDDLTQVWIRDTVQTINALSWQNGPFEGCNASQLTIYCEADAKPDGWSDYWALVGENTPATVVWSQKTSPF